MDNLISLLNEEKDYATGEKIAITIAAAFNKGGSYRKIAKQLYDSLEEKGKKDLICLWALAGLEFAYRWIATGFNDWDERKKASQRYSYNNLTNIEKLFKKVSGITVDLSHESMCKIKDEVFFTHWINATMPTEFRNKKNEWLLGFITKWQNEHSTLRQSFFGGMTNGVISEIYSAFTEDTFPFI